MRSEEWLWRRIKFGSAADFLYQSLCVEDKWYNLRENDLIGVTVEFKNKENDHGKSF